MMNDEAMEEQMLSILNILDRAEDGCLELLLENLLEEEPCACCTVSEYLEENQTRILSEIYKVAKDNPGLAAGVAYRESMRAAMSAILLERIASQVENLFEEEIQEICTAAND